MLGGNESRGGIFSAGADENSFMYRRKKDNGLVEEIKGYIEAHMGQKSVPQAKGNDLAGQLAKLAQLRDDGVLSEEEFAQAKQRALSDD